ncbi:hypothetical protein A21D_01546 [Virgibacillus dokdonensis]|uniref:Uncharacterized protein n=1 Tax=Virgibacillus dokdonensis TaxID=302167 RepID=A0A2K9IY64_9BACI|nr:hypothetical protein A21D_01546 [Virgibacillus dokdonensis]
MKLGVFTGKNGRDLIKINSPLEKHIIIYF